jgi:hypothetical protein
MRHGNLIAKSLKFAFPRAVEIATLSAPRRAISWAIGRSAKKMGRRRPAHLH